MVMEVFISMINKRTITFFSIFILLINGIASLSSCDETNEEETRTIVDCSGASVKIPKNIKKIISVNQSFVAFMTAMGEDEKLIGTHGSVLSHQWTPIFSEHVSSVSRYGYQPNSESIYASGADLVVLNDIAYAESLRKQGINAIYFNYDNIEELFFALDLMTDIFGENSKKWVNNWKLYLEETINNIEDDISSLKEEQRKNIYYINASVNPGNLYSTFGGDSFANYWINTIGANLVTSNFNNITEIDPEVALSLNPDTIFISGYAEYTRKNELINDPLWKNIEAVEENNIFLMPTSFASYERFSVELPLLFDYSANAIYPDLHEFDGIEILSNFYEKFYNKTFSTQHLQNMLLGLAPDGGYMG